MNTGFGKIAAAKTDTAARDRTLRQERTMKLQANVLLRILAVMTACGAMAWSQALPADIKAKADAKINEIKAWGSDPQVVAAVQAYNAAPRQKPRE